VRLNTRGSLGQSRKRSLPAHSLPPSLSLPLHLSLSILPRPFLPLHPPHTAVHIIFLHNHCQDSKGWVGWAASKASSEPRAGVCILAAGSQGRQLRSKVSKGVWERAELVGPHRDPSSAEAPRLASRHVAGPGDRLRLSERNDPEP